MQDLLSLAQVADRPMHNPARLDTLNDAYDDWSRQGEEAAEVAEKLSELQGNLLYSLNDQSRQGLSPKF